jgi:hypothetical protein
MASIKISELDNVTTLVDSDALPIVNGNETKKVTISKLGDILATKDYVNEAIGDIGSTGFTPIIVETLPTSNISTSTVYLVLNEQQADKNIYNEYIYVGGKWEIVGSTAVDLSNYYTKSEIDSMISGGTSGEVTGDTGPSYKIYEARDVYSSVNSSPYSVYASSDGGKNILAAAQKAFDNGDYTFRLRMWASTPDLVPEYVDTVLTLPSSGNGNITEKVLYTYVRRTTNVSTINKIYNSHRMKMASGVVTTSSGTTTMIMFPSSESLVTTTSLTTTLDPYATKTYVDDKINVVNLDVSGFKANTFEISGSTTGYASSDANVKAALEKIAKLGGKNCLLYIHNGYGSSFCTFTGDFNSSTGGYGYYYVGFYTEDTSDRNSVKYTVTCNYSSNGSPANISIIYNTMQGFACTSNVLTKTNATSYTPSANYHPATKKYVDDAIANIDIPESGGSTIQYKVMPNSETMGDGTIVQYVGETNQDYTNGFWYKWVANEIQVENQLNKVTVIDGTKVSTGIIPSNHRVEMCFEWLEYENDSHAIGTADFNGVNGALHFTIYNNKYYWGYGNNENNFGTFQPGIHTVVFNADENYSLTLNGEIKGAAKATSPTEITLFNRGPSANFNGNFYYLKIWDYDTDELLMYLVPYLNASGNPAIYDVVGQREMTHTGPGFTAGELLDANTTGTWEQINVQTELVAGNNIEIKDGVISAIGNSIPFITISDGFTNNGEYDVISDLMTKWYKKNGRLDNFTFINKSAYGSSNISIWAHMYGTGTGSNTISMQKITFSSPPSLTNNNLKNYYVSFSEWSFRFTINAGATVTYQGKTYVRAHGTVMDLKNYDGYDATKTQILKNINGTIKWEEEVNVTEVSEAEY